jgi:hypothetical protein
MKLKQTRVVSTWGAVKKCGPIWSDPVHLADSNYSAIMEAVLTAAEGLSTKRKAVPETGPPAKRARAAPQTYNGLVEAGRGRGGRGGRGGVRGGHYYEVGQSAPHRGQWGGRMGDHGWYRGQPRRGGPAYFNYHN